MRVLKALVNVVQVGILFAGMAAMLGTGIYIFLRAGAAIMRALE